MDANAASAPLSTAGLQLRTRSRALREAVELVSSMRFAIALLTLIGIAATIGTVVRQHEPLANYVNQFGPYWTEVFRAAGLFTVYSAPWFLLILAVLVLSTSLCIARNAPKILADLRSYKEHVRERSLLAFHHKGEGRVAADHDATLARVAALLGAAGWKAKAQTRRDGATLSGTMVAARKGMAHKVGYLAAHSAIVLICLGGLSDGDLIVRAQMAFSGKSPFDGSGVFADVGPEHRLGASNPTFRANLFVAEGARAGTAVITMPDGVVLQELPFDVELKKFIVEYYATGMPKLFASDIVIHDRASGQAIPATVKVNEPVTWRGVTIYQSSFDDGGSKVSLHALPMKGGSGFDVGGRIGESTALVNKAGGEKLTIEFTGLRVINVENLGGAPGAGGAATDVRRVDLAGALSEHLGSGAKTRGDRKLVNVGPSVSYKLRDASGQAREFNNYMRPIELDGQRVFLAGVRDNPSDNFRYLRLPADENDSLEGWARLRAALADPTLRTEAARRYVALGAPNDNPEMATQLRTTAERGLALFAGVEPGRPGAKASGGLQGLVDFIDANVPEPERARISEVLLRIVNGSLFELNNLARAKAGLAALEAGERAQAFMTAAVLSLSDSFFYPAPVLLELTGFEQVQASVFQVARAPGKTLVYLGAALLIVGVFAMLYVRERRLWIWLQPARDGSTNITTAMSATRHTLDGDAEFERLKQAILAPRESPP